MGPETVAQWVLVLPGMCVPSFMCHFTLTFHQHWIRSSGGGKETYWQPSWVKTSVKNGTPATTPWLVC